MAIHPSFIGMALVRPAQKDMPMSSQSEIV